MSFSGKTVVVTGAASGIGLATAEAFAAQGARVVIADIAVEKAQAEAERIGAGAVAIALDVTKDELIAAFAKTLADGVGDVDVLANVAGWGKIQPFLENDAAFWDTVVGVNFMGPVKLTRALLPGMIGRGGGRIVNVSSDAGRVGSLGETVYSGAKAGIIGFSKGLAREVARHAITVNCVCPGPTDTPLLAKVPEKHQEAFVRATPMRRLAKPSEIAHAILFFASEEAGFVTGQVLSVSGGLAMAG
ncbi:3-oxoacyl-[acyl-carrier protein] reductase [Rhodovulum sp. PH10]|uniref:SDR family NAD(P)-dependent oxidoreductase n=1 Tax=Rhodovulum sp. PH10 TaxID=1187851 RepID=UPI00027C238F|nr:SDR family NAD(P)-dependent oxidoreductase [Rhodovulum sp. PH10]EJW11388.1 3-oxoacyl-[acyl-carrier protein] reductase [Rhodovulum sp. PH10]